MPPTETRPKSFPKLAILGALALLISVLALSVQTETEACKHCRSTKDHSSLAWGKVALQTSVDPSPVSRGCDHDWVPIRP